VITTKLTESTNEDGQIILGENKLPGNYQWLITATQPGPRRKPMAATRFAYLGFTHVWYHQRHDPEYNADRTFVITDRPVYRPENVVQFKMWIEHSKYDQPDVAAFAGKTFQVLIHDPKGGKVHEKNYTADEYGGIAGEYPLPSGATLGVYGVQVLDPAENVTTAAATSALRNTRNPNSRSRSPRRPSRSSSATR